MKIRFGKSTIDGTDAPIAIYLTPEERANVAKMPPGCAILCDYPKDKYTEQEINKWLGVKGVVKDTKKELKDIEERSHLIGNVGDMESKTGIDPRWKDGVKTCGKCGNNICEGDAIAVSKDGFFIHSGHGLDMKRIGTLKGGRVRMI